MFLQHTIILMTKQTISRRKAVQIISASTGVAMMPKGNDLIMQERKKNNFTYCLNMATIRGHKLGFVKELQTAAAAGFHSVEIWIDTWHEYLDKGGSVAEARKLLNGLGLTVEDCIAFHEWIVDDDAARAKAIEQMKKDMDAMAQIGCKRMAATGKGTTPATVPALKVIAERYHTILEVGDTYGVVPQIEMWGFQKNLSNVAEVMYIAMESRHPSARMLLDIYHLYRGNTSLDTLHLINPSAVDILHMNDYPAGFNHEKIIDADRIYPGDGIAPLKQILKTLQRNDQPLVLSVEVFNKAYYAQDALKVAKASYDKLKAVVEAV
jgi:2-keto-myo-inositol isomerase